MSSYWTDSQNKLFEDALAIYDEDTPDRWHKVAHAVGCGKTVEDVKKHYKWLKKDMREILTRDVRQIESEEGGQGSHSSSSSGSGSSSNSCGRNNSDNRMRHPKPQ